MDCSLFKKSALKVLIKMLWKHIFGHSCTRRLRECEVLGILWMCE